MIDRTVGRFVLALAAPFDAIDVDDVVEAEGPARDRARNTLIILGTTTRQALVDVVSGALSTARPWETTRLIRAVAAAVQAGVMPAEEAWPILVHAARRMQQAYASWASYGDALSDDFDGVTDGRGSCRDTVAGLLRSPALWTTVPWTVDLGEAPTRGP